MSSSPAPAEPPSHPPLGSSYRTLALLYRPASRASHLVQYRAKPAGVHALGKFAATCARISIPTISASRKVPVRGQPNRSPGQRIHVPQWSVPAPASGLPAVNITATPIRFAIKFGVSLAKHHLLAQIPVRKSRKRSHYTRIRLRSRNNLQQPHIPWRIEKMRPEKPLPIPSGEPAAICFTGSPEVFVVSIAFGPRCGTTSPAVQS